MNNRQPNTGSHFEIRHQFELETTSEFFYQNSTRVQQEFWVHT